MSKNIIRADDKRADTVRALSVPPDSPPVAVRRPKPEDAAACGQVCFDAFYKISTDHGFPPDFPSPDVATGLLSMMFSHPGFYCVVGESGGRMVGSNCLDERSVIAGVGPITVEPTFQNFGVGQPDSPETSVDLAHPGKSLPVDLRAP